jgi:N-acyl-D-aspartate/D-glutamate deacylase
MAIAVDTNLFARGSALTGAAAAVRAPEKEGANRCTTSSFVYDGQATWDSEVAPSSWHGVTSVVFGNCGVGFAPAAREKHDFLISLMEGVEDIPGTALAEGLTWEWESLPEYLDALDRRPHTIDLGAQVPHAALRAYVMGERGADHEIDPSPDEIDTMAELTKEALLAGALASPPPGPRTIVAAPAPKSAA